VNLYLISIHLGRIRGFLDARDYAAHIDALRALPYQLEEILNQTEAIRQIAVQFANARDFLFLGRGINYPTALEGALKLKEISYIHATGYAAGEMKHGPIALIDANMPVVCINPQSGVYDKMLNNIQEVAARQGIIISLVSNGDVKTRSISSHTITIPACSEYTSPVLAVVPLQLLAYYIATSKGLDVDRPRNLAKSVTVE
jgi:glucosamine--fructose-6-phosphate aminotransferase (isomerizing)